MGLAHFENWHPVSSYIFFPDAKKPGITCIGIFGCSFVHGFEITAGHDFPSFLSKRFKEAGIDTVEVINFGVAGYGTHQAYMMWDFVGKKYNLDYVIFLSLALHENRDRTFVFGNKTFSQVHGRYILRHGDAVLMPVEGASLLEATEHYFRFIPPWRYVRYDQKAPVSFDALNPVKSRELDNPFYYKSRTEKDGEIRDIYSILFQKLGRDAKKAVVIIEDEELRKVAAVTSAPRLAFLHSCAGTYRNNFLYKAPGHHHSALGYRMQADELFDYLMGRDHPSIDYFKVTSCGLAPPLSPVAKPLYTYSKVCAGIEKTAAAHFGLPTETGCPDPRCLRSLDFRKSSIASLLQQTDGMVTKFAPLSFLLHNGEPVNLCLGEVGQKIMHPLGIVQVSGGVVGRMLLSSTDFAGVGGREALRVHLDHENSLETISIHGLHLKAGTCELALGEKTALRGKENLERRVLNRMRSMFLFRNPSLLIHSYHLEPLAGEYSYLKAGPGEFVDIGKLANATGHIELILTDAQGATTTCPTFLRYTVCRSHAPPFREPGK